MFLIAPTAIIRNTVSFCQFTNLPLSFLFSFCLYVGHIHSLFCMELSKFTYVFLFLCFFFMVFSLPHTSTDLLQLIQMHLHPPHHHNFTMHNSKISHYIKTRCSQIISIMSHMITLIISINRIINFKCHHNRRQRNFNRNRRRNNPSLRHHRNNIKSVDFRRSSSLWDNLRWASITDQRQIISIA